MLGETWGIFQELLEEVSGYKSGDNDNKLLAWFIVLQIVPSDFFFFFFFFTFCPNNKVIYVVDKLAVVNFCDLKD